MKRFYKQAAAAPVDGGWQVMLDGRGVKSVGGRPQVVPTQALAEAMAAEWGAQGEEIDPAGFILRDQADYAIDVVAPDPGKAVAALLAFAGSDTLCYRADPEDALFRRQQDVWEPLLGALETAEGVRFERISGIIHRRQPEATLARLQARLDEYDPFTLAALGTMASLAASLCIALAALDPAADSAALWQAANLEEVWQAELWGEDVQAAERLARRGLEFATAREFAQMVRTG
ncbi:MAG: molecular chaperone [Sphingomonadales bacterium]|nr:molecular chaperone [Sphingomonadales bacterium]MBD3773677.1 molecular chaperone [Paracoccaceae bacterium]